MKVIKIILALLVVAAIVAVGLKIRENKKASDQLKEDSKAAASATGNVASDIAQSAKEVATNATQIATNVAAKVQQSTSNVVNKVTNFTTNAVEQVKQKL